MRFLSNGLTLFFVGAAAGMPAAGQTTIENVPGLADELSARPMVNLRLTPPGVLHMREDGTIEVLRGRPDECIRGDGTLAPCGSIGTSAPTLVMESPTGAINGQNVVFQLSQQPATPSTLHLFRNGVLQTQGTDYTLSGSTVTFVNAVIPTAGDILTASFFPVGQMAAMVTMTAAVTASSVGNVPGVAALSAPTASAPTATIGGVSAVATLTAGPSGTGASQASAEPPTAGARGIDGTLWKHRAASPTWERFRKTVHGGVKEAYKRNRQPRQSTLVPTLTIEEEVEQ